MATQYQHYEEAERELAKADLYGERADQARQAGYGGESRWTEQEKIALLRAQVHATLATVPA
jgi:hypothetical protein